MWRLSIGPQHDPADRLQLTASAIFASRQALCIRGDGLGQNLDRHLALQLGVGRLIHLPHAADANLGRTSYGPRRVRGEGHPYPSWDAGTLLARWGRGLLQPRI